MTTLARNKQRAYETGDFADVPLAASTTIYEGAAVGEDGSNGHRPLVAGDRFVGFAYAKATSGNARVLLRGRVELPVSGFAAGDVGLPIYASDDDTFTKTASTNTLIGKAIRFVSSGVAVVAYDADAPLPKVAASLEIDAANAIALPAAASAALAIVAAIPTADQNDSETIWNDTGVLKVSSAP